MDSHLDMTQGLTPDDAISTIFRRTPFGSGLPLMKVPPSWLRRPCTTDTAPKSANENWRKKKKTIKLNEILMTEPLVTGGKKNEN